jgi:hypothetical protein
VVANQPHLTGGFSVRTEERWCPDCADGEFSGGSDYKCSNCRESPGRTLYQHDFMIDERPYCFHSYCEPRLIAGEKGVDSEVYGRAFSDDELPLPSQSTLVKLVELGLMGVLGLDTSQGGTQSRRR